MHRSSSLRPRQRTSTSCTECRRRKQKCNQAKDRPCNNCARRYPPVVCTYEFERVSSKKSSREQIVDFPNRDPMTPRDGQILAPRQGHEGLHPVYGSLNGAGSSVDYPALAALEQPYTSSGPSYYAPPHTIDTYAGQNQYATSPTFYTPPSSGAYADSVGSPSSATATSGPGYSAAYYSPAYGGYTAQADWLSPNLDSPSFVGSSNAYDAPSELPLDLSPRGDADPFQLFAQEPRDNRWRRSSSIEWDLDTASRRRSAESPPLYTGNLGSPPKRCWENVGNSWNSAPGYLGCQ